MLNGFITATIAALCWLVAFAVNGFLLVVQTLTSSPARYTRSQAPTKVEKIREWQWMKDRR